MEKILEYLPLLIPVILVEWGLAAAALIHLLRHPNYRFGTRVVWILVVLLVQIIGPVVYFAFGRGQE
ncbi:MAG: PLDc N-terminal domain-containing protein [Clostridia bacterium]|nr:PLDc N-terminal domain-containing protein [Clostridia bacterium]